MKLIRRRGVGVSRAHEGGRAGPQVQGRTGCCIRHAPSTSGVFQHRCFGTKRGGCISARGRRQRAVDVEHTSSDLPCRRGAVDIQHATNGRPHVRRRRSRSSRGCPSRGLWHGHQALNFLPFLLERCLERNLLWFFTSHDAACVSLAPCVMCVYICNVLCFSAFQGRVGR